MTYILHSSNLVSAPNTSLKTDAIEIEAGITHYVAVQQRPLHTADTVFLHTYRPQKRNSYAK